MDLVSQLVVPLMKSMSAQPLLLALLVAGFYLAAVKGPRRRRRFNRSWRRFSAKTSVGDNKDGSLDAADQLRLVMQAEFQPRALLNQGERRLLAHLDRALAECSPGWRAMGQVSLGEILSSKDPRAYSAVNSKRVDLLIVDADCRPLQAVEFQGKGHYQGTAAVRDAVKKEALRRAGIGYVEVVPGDTPAELRQMVRKLVARASAV